MAKNLIICCDGTNNQFGTNNTNVVRLVQVLNRDPQKQLVYYDPGVGTMPEPGFVTPIGKQISKVFGLAFGAGLSDKIGEAYKFLMDHYEPGDNVYMFGFSRGSYTVRALAGMLYQFGLLPAGSDNLIPYVLKYYKAINHLDGASQDQKNQYWTVSDNFRETFARINYLHERSTRIVRIRFLGLWDTVSSVGWVWEPVHFPYTASNPSIDIVRHAISLDEHRAFFRQNRWFKKPPESPQNVWEVWFPGVHCDVGGGYPESEGGLWRTPFLWMLIESKKAGLLIRSSKVRELLKKTPVPLPPWANQQHESLDWKWWLAEFFPKTRKCPNCRIPWPYINFFRHRSVQEGAELHRSVLRRLRRPGLNYQPPNLSPEFCAHVKSLSAVPSTLPYHPSGKGL